MSSTEATILCSLAFASERFRKYFLWNAGFVFADPFHPWKTTSCDVPRLSKLFDELGVDTIQSDMSLSIAARGVSGVEDSWMFKRYTIMIGVKAPRLLSRGTIRSRLLRKTWHAYWHFFSQPLGAHQSWKTLRLQEHLL